MSEPAILQCEEKVITGRQKTLLTVVATIVSLILGLQSYGILPYEMRDVKTRIERMEKAERDNIALVATFQAQLVGAREEIVLLRGELSTFRREIFRRTPTGP